MRGIISSSCASLLVLVGVGRADVPTTNWPIQRTNEDHPVAATLGEFISVGGVIWQHEGIDILATPCENVNHCLQGAANCVNECTRPCGNPEDASPQGCVYSTAAGIPTRVNQDPNGAWTYTHIEPSGNQYVYQYYHLTYGSFDAAFYAHYIDGTLLGPNFRINRVGPWSCPEEPEEGVYDHLHYGLYERMAGGKIEYLNPLGSIDSTVRPDTQAPEIFDISLVKGSTRWSPFPIAGSCTVVKGQVDVVAHLRDRDDAASPLPVARNVGVYNLRWRACPPTDPDCDWNETHRLSRMPGEWNLQGPANPHTAKQFGTTTPFASSFNMCPAPDINNNIPIDQTYMVATSEPSASWNTTSGFPNGTYTVSVQATDIADNAATATLNACVYNPPCNDLAIRDGNDDVGIVPYTGSPFYLSPDITANPGTPDENQNIKEGSANTIQVQVWNKGSCALPAGAQYSVCLGWNPPSGSVPFPLASNQTIDCKTETVPAGGWAPDVGRPTTFSWTPAAGTLPSGHACLVAWSSTPSDLPQPTSSVVLDNNRAQRNISFVSLPSPGSGSSAEFWMNPLPDMPERSMDMRFRGAGADSAVLYLVVPPSVHIGRIVNARILWSFRASAPLERCLAGDARSCARECPVTDSRRERGCTLVLGEFDTTRPVRLESLTVDEPARLLLAASSRGIRPTDSFSAEVVERGGMRGQPHQPIGGVAFYFGRRPASR